MCAQTRHVSENMAIPGPATAVWALLGDFNGLYRWHPAVVDSQLEGERTQPGSLRTLTLADGAKLQEALISLDDTNMHYRYRITAGPLPIREYESEIAITDDGNGHCTVSWQSSFQANGVPAGDAEQIVRDIYRSGLQQLAALFS